MHTNFAPTFKIFRYSCFMFLMPSAVEGYFLFHFCAAQELNQIQWRIYIVKFWTRPPPWGPKFFQFPAVFGKIWQNRMLAPPPGSWRPLLGEILDPPLKFDATPMFRLFILKSYQPEFNPYLKCRLLALLSSSIKKATFSSLCKCYFKRYAKKRGLQQCIC